MIAHDFYYVSAWMAQLVRAQVSYFRMTTIVGNPEVVSSILTPSILRFDTRFCIFHVPTILINGFLPLVSIFTPLFRHEEAYYPLRYP